MVIGKVHLTEKFARYRIKSPGIFKKGSMRTQALGESGDKRIAGRLKKNNEWETQAILLPLKKYKRGERVKIVNGRAKIVK
jgi:hypothetical protein